MIECCPACSGAFRPWNVLSGLEYIERRYGGPGGMRKSCARAASPPAPSVTDADRRKADELAYAVRDAEAWPARRQARDAIATALAAERSAAEVAMRNES